MGRSGTEHVKSDGQYCDGKQPTKEDKLAVEMSIFWVYLLYPFIA